MPWLPKGFDFHIFFPLLFQFVIHEFPSPFFYTCPMMVFPPRHIFMLLSLLFWAKSNIYRQFIYLLEMNLKSLKIIATLLFTSFPLLSNVTVIFWQRLAFSGQSSLLHILQLVVWDCWILCTPSYGQFILDQSPY